mmetsp:Transcript_7201/g.9744  ORF Transcript_7201/g.9744 Transcript_7201/m.9744 type:complete len:196 (+) Transcript_7201:99-686(+)|eukprot:CAMPEP_0196580108 /NCGR_PEP_ID=MMETSP1081-20130531/27002_1 /TAXON_ID=36882 /ORGANISM="Pyramimonas amylifera, Strain CCMP720" /LENGTH=195 /DNA_ID=CAMNT_0041899893 /DNA_START=99 /DNA_END=686 /DNA_ORIENTATION=+
MTFSRVPVCVLLLLTLSPRANACDGAYCGRLDQGSCGNACCKLEWTFHLPAETVMKHLNQSIQEGGPDGSYKASAMYEGGTGFADLTPFGAPASFIGQVVRTTRIKKFNDTLNFALYKTSDETTKVTAFSISQIGGALGDDGQNYSNLEELVQASGLVFTEETVMGCPVPEASHRVKRRSIGIAGRKSSLVINSK